MPEVKRKKNKKEWVNVTRSSVDQKVNWYIIGWNSTNKQKADEKYRILGIYPKEKERGVRRHV